MYAQTVMFEGPRSAELVAANERAGLERIEPAVSADPELMADLVATFVLRRPDGGELVVTITDTEAALDRADQVITSTELLPGEDPALLMEPDRIERYNVVHTFLGKAALR
jgi:hypothetical protein